MARTRARVARQRTQPGSETERPVSPDLAKRFVAEYLKDLNGTQAYLRASPTCKSEKAASVASCRLLGNASVQNLVQAGERRQIQTRELSAARVLEEFRRLAFFDVADLFDDHGHLKPIKAMTPEARAAIAGLEVATANFDKTDGKRNYNEWLHKIKLANKGHALEMLGKHFRLLDRQAENEGGDFEKFVARINRARQRVAAEKRGKR